VPDHPKEEENAESKANAHDGEKTIGIAQQLLDVEPEIDDESDEQEIPRSNA